jgi:hypothetical protein
MPEWKPAEQKVVRNQQNKLDLERTGYTVPYTLERQKLSQLKELYTQTHNFNLDSGGMFYSVYSQDLQYRKHVHEKINEILKEVYDELFEDYKIVISSFIVKVNGPDSAFSIHQDSTGLDEMTYSPLSVWIPLQDTTIENGCLAVIPQSFKLFSPYRGISFPEPFQNIKEEIRHYLQPIELKAGDVLLFDNRLVHYSPPNNSCQDRVVVMSGIFPKNAQVISCYKDINSKNNEIEIYEQNEEYLLTFKNFFHDCTCRPETGVLSQRVNWPINDMNKDSFINLAKENKIPKISHPKLVENFKSNIVPEPS